MLNGRRGFVSLFISAASAVGILASVQSADAGTYGTIFFDDATVAGHAVSYDGAGGPLTGLSFFDTISSWNVPTNNGVELFCEGCEWHFRTNQNVFESADAWTFAPGGSVSLTGAVKNGVSTFAAGTLLRGYFNSETKVVKQGPLHITVSGSLAVQMDENLSDFYGLDRNFWLREPNGLGILTQIGLVRGSVDPLTYAFDAAVMDTDLNYLYVTPGPSAFPLLLTALGGLGLIGWRRSAVRMAGAETPHQ